MGIMSKAAAAKSANSGDYAKAGTYFLMIENCKEDKTQDNASYAAVETRIVYVVDKALWTGPVADVPKGKEDTHLLNLPGQEPKPLDPVSFVFVEVPLDKNGAGARLKKLVLVAMGNKTDRDWDEAVANAAKAQGITNVQAQDLLMAKISDPVQQPLRGCVVEIKGSEYTTKKGEKIINTRPLRRVYMEELAKLHGENRLTPDVVDYLVKDNRLQNQIEKEKQERAIKATAAGK